MGKKESIVLTIISLVLLGLVGYFGHLNGLNPVIVIGGVILALLVFSAIVVVLVRSFRRFGLKKTSLGLISMMLITGFLGAMIFADGFRTETVSKTAEVVTPVINFFWMNLVVIIFTILIVSVLFMVWRKFNTKITLIVLAASLIPFTLLYGTYALFNFRADSLLLPPQEQLLVGGAIVVFLVISIFMFVLPALFIGGMIALFVGISKTSLASDGISGKTPIIYQVPSNHVRIVRWAFGSDPGNRYFPGSDKSDINNPDATKDDGSVKSDAKKSDAKKSDAKKSDAKKSDAKKSDVIKEKPASGYWVQEEGYQIFIPILFVNEGVYSLDPNERKLEEIKVTSRDNLSMFLNMQLTTRLADVERFAISMKGKTVEDKEKERAITENNLIHTAANRACRRYNGEELQSIICQINKGDDDTETRRRYFSVLRQYYDDNTDTSNPKKGIKGRRDYLIVKGKRLHVYECGITKLWDLAFDKFKILTGEREVVGAEQKVTGAEKEVAGSEDLETFEYFKAEIPLGDEIMTELKNLEIYKQYGIYVDQTGVQNALTPKPVRDALERERVSEIELRAAPKEGAVVQKIIEKVQTTKADPTKIVMTQMIVDGLNTVFGKSFQSKQLGKKSKKQK